MGLDKQTRQVMAEIEQQLATLELPLAPSQMRLQAQARSDRYGLARTPLDKVTDYAVAGPAQDIPVRAYQPDRPVPQNGWPTLLYFHGGGFVIGDLETHDALCRYLCSESGVQVLAVDYRRAPEATFPAAHEDALAVLDAIAMAPEEYEIDLSRVVVGGDSAGGNIAVVLAHACIGRDDIMLAGQMLLYPWLRLSPAPDSPSKRHWGQGYGVELSDLNQFALLYDPRLDWDAPTASPFYLGELWGLPPAFVASIEHDPLCDEAEVFAMRLAQQGIAVTWRRYLGTVHSCAVMAGAIDQGRYMLDDAAQWLHAMAQPAR
ncbi:alpha/beta hydrolase [Larsenimonas rhizosphaerae]|uniref:Alpha/beta hydrolase n=1 Tax=Larsenimonas rhizosphaerae TaxID=2944682 RepID=A0AA41ZIB5_9GAMM|nr:alpha/beta hydrolase [Larsenimonas rhizosphaerae]MCX2524388.1 alpha/beta hydrolase [Larsenimonas rhizosphaerae]